ncbi:MAG: 2-oxoacid:acceptor oxidoreductase family protein [Eubacteriales bacterium]|nr:2-oxoacid:acceptor oxidoreductase family protein [Eubacteriales bacterium]MDD4582835.1 2-oxoacid:acceptor oxidoreductase family protein [Eubacteriales bacterium]
MIQIKIYGLGGQGVVTCGKILAHAFAINQKQFAQTIPAYGHERRGAPVNTSLILDEEPILTKTFVYQPDYVMVLDVSVVDRGIDIFEGTDEETVFLFNAPALPEFMKGRKNRAFFTDATAIARKNIKRDIPNTGMAGAFAAMEIISIEAVYSAIQYLFSEKGDGRNVKGARECFETIREG